MSNIVKANQLTDTPVTYETDNINPAHYKVGGIETIDYLQAKLSPDEFNGYCKGNVLKYVSRANHKGGVQDYKKAAWYLDRLIEEVMT